MSDKKNISKPQNTIVSLKKFRQCGGFDCKLYFNDGTILFARPITKGKKYNLSVDLSCILLHNDTTNYEIEIPSIKPFLKRLRKISIPVLSTF